MFGLIIISEEIVSCLFGYGSFDQVSVRNSANALLYFSLGLPAYSLIKIFLLLYLLEIIREYHSIFHQYQFY